MSKRKRKTRTRRRTSFFRLSFFRSILFRRVLAYFGISSPAVLLLILLQMFGVPVPMSTEEATAQAKAKIAQKVTSLMEQPTHVVKEAKSPKDSAPTKALPIDTKNPAEVVRVIGWLLDPKSSHSPKPPVEAPAETKPAMVHTPKDATNASRERGGWGEEDPHPWRFRR